MCLCVYLWYSDTESEFSCYEIIESSRSDMQLSSLWYEKQTLF